jgi:hypothetical protein
MPIGLTRTELLREFKRQLGFAPPHGTSPGQIEWLARSLSEVTFKNNDTIQLALKNAGIDLTDP